MQKSSNINPKVKEDFTIINYLYSLTQGHFVQFNTLAHLNQLKSDVALKKTQELLKTLSLWKQKTYNNQAVFTSATDKSVKICSDIINFFIKDLESTTTAVINSLQKEKFQLSLIKEKNLFFYFSLISRYVYTKENYFKGILSFLENYNITGDYIENTQKELDSYSVQINAVHHILKALKNSSLTEQNILFILTSAFTLPGNFRCQVCDLLQLITKLKHKEFSFDNLNINNGIANQWKEIGLPPKEAGYWNAFFITPLEFAGWAKYGITDYSLAGAWKSFGFNPDQAIPWIKNDIKPEIAVFWQYENYSPEEAKNFIEQGFIIPSAIPPQK